MPTGPTSIPYSSGNLRWPVTVAAGLVSRFQAGIAWPRAPLPRSPEYDVGSGAGGVAGWASRVNVARRL